MSSPVSNEPVEAPVQQAESRGSGSANRNTPAGRSSGGSRSTARDGNASGRSPAPVEQALTSPESSDNSGGNARSAPTGQASGGEDTTLVGAMRKIAENETRKIHTFDLGLVTSIFPHESESDDQNYYCSVRLRDSDSDELRNVPVLTQHIGMVHVPNVGDLVMIGYIGGSVNSPVVMGSLYNDEQRPPVNKAGEIVYESPDDEDSSGDLRRVFMKLPSGIEIKITDKKVSFHIPKSDTTFYISDDGYFMLSTEGKATIVYNPDSEEFIMSGYGSKTYFSGKNETIVQSREGGLKIKSAGNMTIQCGGDLTIKATNIKMESTADTEVKAMNVKAEAQVNADLKASVNMTVSGDVVTTVKGQIVKIN